MSGEGWCEMFELDEVWQRPIAVVGAGTMGWKIALQLDAHDAQVRLYDRDRDVLEHAMAEIAQMGAELALSGELPERASDLSDRVRAVHTLAEAVDGSWYVVEAIPERMDLKRRLFAELSASCDPQTILATNSSSFMSRHLADVTTSPTRLMNSHFYNFPWRRSGVELMSCGETTPELLELVAAFLRRCGLIPVIARAESTGFVFNRVWHAVKRESLQVVAEGVATPEEVDRLWCLSMEAPLGPFAMMDRVGLDVVLDIERHYAEMSGDPKDEPPGFLAEMVARGELGRKSGRGFYTYPNPAWERPGWPRDER